MADAADPPARSTPRSLGAVDGAPPRDARRRVVNRGGLYLNWRQLTAGVGVAASLVGVVKGVLPATVAMIEIPAEVRRAAAAANAANVSAGKTADVVRDIQTAQATLRSDVDGVANSQQRIVVSQEQLTNRVTTLEATVAGHETLKGERGRALDELRDRVGDVERSLREPLRESLRGRGR